jgi:CBS domain protein
MTSEVVTIEPRDTAVTAAQRMIEEEKGPLPEVDAGQVVGMMTDRDLVAREVAAGRDPRSVRVGDIDTQPRDHRARCGRRRGVPADGAASAGPYPVRRVGHAPRRYHLGGGYPLRRRAHDLTITFGYPLRGGVGLTGSSYDCRSGTCTTCPVRRTAGPGSKRRYVPWSTLALSLECPARREATRTDLIGSQPVQTCRVPAQDVLARSLGFGDAQLPVCHQLLQRLSKHAPPADSAHPVKLRHPYAVGTVQ